MTDELTLAAPPGEETTEEHLILWEDAILLEALEVEGRAIGREERIPDAAGERWSRRRAHLPSVLATGERRT
jgi:hypothetical protein